MTNDFNNIENDSTNSRNEKRFSWNGTSDGFGSIMDNETGEYLSYSQCISKLNELHEENQSTKHLLKVHIEFCRANGYELKDILDFVEDNFNNEEDM